jgi:hypothetical protein
MILVSSVDTVTIVWDEWLIFNFLQEQEFPSVKSCSWTHPLNQFVRLVIASNVRRLEDRLGRTN